MVVLVKRFSVVQ
uniref:Uncharacterized protein n=1 Tax=Anopheles quadriannulatus TaxID=34691 RepID=A0A182XTG3_ANOQN